MGKREYSKAVKIIVELNEIIVQGEKNFEDSPLLNELAKLRKIISKDDENWNAVISRLITSLFIQDKVITVDEASPL